MNRFFRLACAISLAVACATSWAEKLRIGVMPLAHHTPIYAQDLGLYKKYGLDVEVTVFQTGPAMVQAVLAGDFVGGSFGPIPMLNLASKGVPMYSLAMDGYQSREHPAGAIMIRPDETRIQSFADLAGKTVGQLGLGTLTYMTLFAATEKYGMKRNAFREVFVPFPQMGQLLASKQVDAVYAWPPYIRLIEKAGQGRVLTDDTPWVPYLVASTLGLSRKWADQNPEQAKLLVKAHIEAGRWVNDHPAEARRIAARWMNLPDDVAGDMRMLYWPRNGYVLLPSIWDQYFMMVKTGQIKPVEDAAAMIQAYYIEPARRFVAPVLQELGIQPDPTTDEVLKTPLPFLEGSPSRYLGPWNQ